MLKVQIVSVPSFLYVVKKLDLTANSSIIFFNFEQHLSFILMLVKLSWTARKGWKFI